jgi:hypothetical protein
MPHQRPAIKGQPPFDNKSAGSVLPALSKIIYLMKVSGSWLCTAGR